MERLKVYQAIDSERNYQDRMEAQGDTHVVSDFPLAAGIAAMEELILNVRREWYYGKDPYKNAMDHVRKIAGVCVKMGEKYGMEERK